MHMGPPPPGERATEVASPPVERGVGQVAAKGATEVAAPLDEEDEGRAARRRSPISGSRTTEVATSTADAMAVDLTSGTHGRWRPGSQRRAGHQTPRSAAASFAAVFGEDMADRGRLVELAGRMKLLEEVRCKGDTVAQRNVVEWARTLSKRVKGGQAGFSSWDAVVGDCRA